MTKVIKICQNFTKDKLSNPDLAFWLEEYRIEKHGQEFVRKVYEVEEKEKHPASSIQQQQPAI